LFHGNGVTLRTTRVIQGGDNGWMTGELKLEVFSS